MNYFCSQITKSGILLFITIIMMSSCKGKKSDDVIKQDVDNKLIALPNPGMVNATVNQGTVTLDGKCEGVDCNIIIGSAIKEVEGVDSVLNNIVIDKGTDLSLRTSVQAIVLRYAGVTADVVNGVVVLRGTVAKEHLQALIDELSALKPKRIDNQLAIE